MSSALDALCGPSGSLHPEPPDATEFANLVRSGEARLADAGRAANSLESRFDLAYNASHALCLAALRYRGYRPVRQRYVVFQALPHTLGLGPEVWRVLDRAHKERNRSEYEGGPTVSDRLVLDLVEATKGVLSALKALPSLPTKA